MTSHQCCFCGHTIEANFPDPVSLTITLPEGAEQQLYCHWNHLKDAVHQSVPLYVWDEESPSPRAADS